MIIYVRQERHQNRKREQLKLVVLLTILFSIVLGTHMLVQKKFQMNQLKLIYSTNDSINYLYVDDIEMNQINIAQTNKLNEQEEFHKFHSQYLSKCFSLEINQPLFDSNQDFTTKITVLKEFQSDQKQIHQTQLEPNQNFSIEIFQMDCKDHKVYIYNAKVTQLLLEQIFQHLEPIKILRNQQFNQLLKQKIILDFNINQKHTMDINKYLSERFSNLLQIFIQCQSHFISIDIFVGDLRDLLIYYEQGNMIYIKNQGSYKYYIQQNGNDYKLIVSGIANNQRLNNLLHILKYYQVDFQKVLQIGSIQEFKYKNTKILLDLFQQLDVVPSVAYQGNRKQGLIEIAKRLYMEELRFVTQNFEETAMSLLKIRNKLVTKSINGIFRYSYLIIGDDVHQQGIIFFRMPNGELSFEATKILLNIGVKKFFMIGAGGAINPNLIIGDYIEITKSVYDEDEVLTYPNKIINLINFNIIQEGSNITIDSPLEETQNWLSKHRQFDCVDVETYHILKALEESPSDVKYLPSIFISDVLLQKPLQEKIGTNNAYRALSNFMQSSFTYLNF